MPSSSERYVALLEALESPEIDLSDIAALKLVTVTRNKIGTRVICLFMDGLSGEVEVDRVLLWLVRSLDQVVNEPFIAVLFNARKKHFFSLGWIYQTYQMLHKKYRTNLEILYFVHPSKSSKLALKMLSPFITDDDTSKLRWISNLNQLEQLLGCPELPIPDYVNDCDRAPCLEVATETKEKSSPTADQSASQIARDATSAAVGVAERRLLVAAALGDLKSLKVQISCNARLNSRDGSGLTALMLGARGGREEVVRQLIAATADVNALAGDGATAVQLASQYGHEAIVCTLIAAGARLNGNSASESALAAAAGTGRSGVVCALLKHGSTFAERGAALLRACDSGNPEVLKQLLSSRISGSQKGVALVRAAALGHSDLVVLLLEHSADCNVLDGTTHSALMRASMLGHNQVVGVLLMAKANLDLSNSDNSCAIHLAVQWNNAAAVQQLATARSNLEVVDDYYLTPLMLAADGGFRDIVDILVEAKSDVNAKDNHGMNALMLASSFGHKEVVQQLVQAGASQDDEDAEGRTAEVFAQMHKNASL